MGNSGLLDAFLMIVATEGIQNSLMIHVLRLIGNTCADTGMSHQTPQTPLLTHTPKMKIEQESSQEALCKR
jgi:hypothetical protein